jgi:hypothetical protein
LGEHEVSINHSGNIQPSIDREEHWHLDGDEDKPGVKRSAAFLYGEAVDGPLVGQYVAVKLQYNSSTGNYELLTAGSGTTTTVDKDGLWNSTNTLWNDTSINWNQT